MSIELDILPVKSWLPSIDNPLLIAGPCSLETEEQTLATARELAKDKRVFVFRGGVWKPRTRPGSFEGIGSIGLEWLKRERRNWASGGYRGGQRTAHRGMPESWS